MQEFYNYKFREEGLSPKTLRNYHMALHRCLQQAVKERLLVYNPCDAVTLPSGEKPEIVVFTNDQQRALVQASYRHRYGVFIRLDLCTGLRMGELLALKWEDIDFSTAQLHVRRTINRLAKYEAHDGENKTEIVFGTPKTKNSRRTIPLTRTMADELTRWKQQQEQDKIRAGDKYTDDGFIVTNKFGHYFEQKTFKDYYNRLLKDADIRAFVGYKNSLGFPYNESIRILGRFDDFCVERFPEKDCLDCELALAWLEKRDTENTAGHRNRIMVIREFAKYLRAVGTEAYMIPISMTSKGPGYVPHLFNEAEIKAFFHGADSFRPHEKAPARHLVIPVFYRLLYCCGLRPAEARLLKKENVDLVRGSVYVVESKGHKDRVVAVADDLLQIMRSYSTLISEIYPDSDYFFPRYDGDGPYTKRWTEEMFWRCFSMAGITAFEGPKPRVYDFRHTFATECICRWMREGRDIDAMLPFLSAYMGHARYEDTLYYVHMVPDFYERVGTVDRTAWEKLLPEVHDEG